MRSLLAILLGIFLTTVPAPAGGRVPFYLETRDAEDQDIRDVISKGYLEFKGGAVGQLRTTPIYLLPCEELKSLDSPGNLNEMILIPADRLPPGIKAAIAPRLGAVMGKLKSVHFQRSVMRSCIAAAEMLGLLEGGEGGEGESPSGQPPGEVEFKSPLTSPLLTPPRPSPRPSPRPAPSILPPPALL